MKFSEIEEIVERAIAAVGERDAERVMRTALVQSREEKGRLEADEARRALLADAKAGRLPSQRASQRRQPIRSGRRNRAPHRRGRVAARKGGA